MAKEIKFKLDDTLIDCQFTYRELVALRIAIGDITPQDMERLMNCLGHDDITRFLNNRKPTHENLLTPLSAKLQTMCDLGQKDPTVITVNGERYIKEPKA